MAANLTLLGFTEAGAAEAVRAAMAGVPGPALVVVAEGGIAALAQTAQPGKRRLQGRDAALAALGCVQMRLESACQAGPFLPAAPAQAACARAELPALLRAAAQDLAVALAARGRLVQWDVILRWPAEAVVRAHRAALAPKAGRPAELAEAIQALLAQDRAARDAALREALAPLCLDILTAGAGETQTGVTVLVEPGRDAAIEAALQRLPAAVTADADADLRGPLPPISFSPVSITTAAAGDVAKAWRQLALPAEIDAGALRQGWRGMARRLHPDLGAHGGDKIAAAGAAYRLLRGLLPASAQAVSLPALQCLAARRLNVPALPAAGQVP